MKIHCIGIGGIGLSALARYYASEGHTVSGSDTSSSAIIEKLRDEGMVVYDGHHKENITNDIDLVVYTIAISPSNEELLQAGLLGISAMTYPEALGEITKNKTTISVSGTHGKTTTTAMMYAAMKACGVNPTLIVGSLIKDEHGVHTNFIQGDSEYLIVEACEYKRSFLNLYPTHAVVTNIDEDHLDYYKDLADIQSAFQSFGSRVPVEGSLTAHADVQLSVLCKKIKADLFDENTIELSVLGKHNKRNSQLVLGLLTSLHFDEKKIREGLKQFTGTWRRMEYKGKTLHGIPLYDDYGHHPREIASSVEALREKYPKGDYRINMLFQPHLYSRTHALLNDFATVLADVDEVCVLPIYKARLEDTSIINEDIVVKAINDKGGNAKKLESLSDIPAYIESVTDSHTVIVNMGAGNAFEELHKVTLV